MNILLLRLSFSLLAIMFSLESRLHSFLYILLSLSIVLVVVVAQKQFHLFHNLRPINFCKIIIIEEYYFLGVIQG